ncbi:NAD(P)H-dependent oxidoreductase [Saccharothrix violaceirubra]|uniref:NAD(P)H-dependent FMN reductase n=1 Tax=Saccharothrix violaceirubra TaxID=413306 RepID=A0A7W7T7V7_9PSEU|nr:NAD(P)H-dependent oxidoreductase [Saccharothrix violaceirubra]MBB4968151.1 NAD(P)H-dependent FMN reductase [Saccharothrix violaceirubra]
MVKLVTVIGSTRDGRFAPVVRDWFARQVGLRDDIEHDVLDLADVRLPDALPAYGEQPAPAVAAAVEAVRPRLAAADAFVVVTPEYNHSFPAALKTAIDWYYAEWSAKPVGFVSYGGVGGGLRAVEQLRQVFVEVHAVPVRDQVSFHSGWERFDEHGEPHEAEAVGGAAKVLLDRVVWWADALKDARARRPYEV